MVVEHHESKKRTLGFCYKKKNVPTQSLTTGSESAQNEFFWSFLDLRALADGPIESLPLVWWVVSWLGGDLHSWKTALTIF